MVGLRALLALALLLADFPPGFSLTLTSHILQMIESGRVQQQRRNMRVVMTIKEGRVTARNLLVISDVPVFSDTAPPYRAFLVGY